MNQQRSISIGLQYLATQQRPDGGFNGLASANPANFNTAVVHKTPFFTSLILNCIAAIPQAKSLTVPMSKYLLQQRSSTWSWNYWERHSLAASQQPYPDDLDDSACALAALTRSNVQQIDGAALAKFAQNLIGTEINVGGPYQTWLLDVVKDPIWYDVDLAVNANVGYALHLQAITLSGLNNYIEQQLQSGELASRYYCNDAPLLYFLARWYDGPGITILRQKTTAALSDINSLSAFELALCLSAGKALHVKAQLLKSAANTLGMLQLTDGSWPAQALYVEPYQDGVAQYAGSNALTTGFVLEALHTPSQSAPIAKEPLYKRLASAQQLQTIQYPELQSRYRKQLANIIQHDHDGQITRMASMTAQALRCHIPSQTIKHLNTASANGWVAYTIYDAVWDDAAQPELLGIANTALRRVIKHFAAALPNSPEFQQSVEQTLTTVDAANTWEIVRARAIRSANGWRFKLPQYRNYDQLADRSWGHSLAARGMFIAAGIAPSSDRYMALEQFFRHFLIARQLNDDAHDWEQDLAAGHTSAVVSELCRTRANHKNQVTIYDSNLPQLRQQFWQQTIDDIAALIVDHLNQAEAALQQCGFADSSYFKRWLDQLRTATNKALAERNEAQKFIMAYAAN